MYPAIFLHIPYCNWVDERRVYWGYFWFTTRGPLTVAHEFDCAWMVNSRDMFERRYMLQSIVFMLEYTPWNQHSRPSQKENLIFQPLIFRGIWYVRFRAFREGNKIGPNKNQSLKTQTSQTQFGTSGEGTRNRLFTCSICSIVTTHATFHGDVFKFLGGETYIVPK